jgi:hypothetical protein
MTRGFQAALWWRVPLWIRRGPGRLGGLAFLLIPAAFLLPLEEMGMVGSRVQGISVLVWLLGLSLPLSVRAASGLRDPVSIWTYQKGCGMGDTALEDWILDLGLFAGFALWWALTGVAALAVSQSVGFRNVLSLWLLGTSVALLTHALTYFLSAAGLSRPSDPVAFLAFSSILMPVLMLEAPGWMASLAHWGMPPFHASMVISGSIRAGDFAEAAGSLLHVFLYSGLALALGTLSISRWKPLQ